MAYPTLPIDPSSRRLVRDGRDEDFSVSGVSHVRDFYGVDKYDFEIHHIDLTSTQLTSLKDHYTANRLATFDFTWPLDGVTYTGLRYGKGGLRVDPANSPIGFNASVRLLGS